MIKFAVNDNWNFKRIPNGNIENTYILDDYEMVMLPHTFYVDQGEPYRGLGIYEKEIEISENCNSVFVEIPGADQMAVVYADGIRIGEHRGGYAAFCIEVPEKSIRKRHFKLSIYLTNKLNDEISPLTGDFTVFGGLYRGVNIICTGKNHFDYTYFGTGGFIPRTGINSDGNGYIDIETHVKCDDIAFIRWSVTDASGKRIKDEVFDCGHKQKIELQSPILWNGKANPYLYTLKGELIVDGKVVDEVQKTIGFRSIRMDSNEGLFLNEEYIRVNGVAKHQDTAGKYSAIDNSDIDRDFELIDEIGANAVRLSHYQHPQYTYDLCDRKGYLAWAEVPMLKMTENKELLSNIEQQLKELILQNIHHPSIFCWGIQNEIGMFKDTFFMHDELDKMREIAHKLDDQRLVTAANLYTVKFKSRLNDTTDMIGYNIYFGWYYGEMRDYDNYLDKFHAERPEMPLGISEYGVDANIKLHSKEPAIRDYSEEYQALYHETVYSIFEKKKYLWGSFVWNMFDFSSSLRKEGGVVNLNSKGLVTYDRMDKKDAFYFYKSKWSEEKFIHICSKRFEKRTDEKIDIKAYTNLGSAVICLNGQEVKQEKNNGNGTIVFKDICLKDGENSISVRSGEYVDSCVFIKQDEEEKSYRLPDSGTGKNVKNWFLEDDDVVKEGFFSIEDSANDILENRDAASVLKAALPKLYEFMTTKDVIPLGLSLKSILNRDDSGVDQKKLNDELNKIPQDN